MKDNKKSDNNSLSFTEKIGRNTYIVSAIPSEDAKGTLEDKVKSLIKRNAENIIFIYELSY